MQERIRAHARAKAKDEAGRVVCVMMERTVQEWSSWKGCQEQRRAGPDETGGQIQTLKVTQLSIQQ